MGDGKAYSFWVDQDDLDLIERFDSIHNTGEGTYSRSKHVKEAIRRDIEIQRTLRRIGYEHLDGKMLQHWLRQCMLDKAAEEATDAE